ncbi:alcohol dehydrogenase catalytic domain-containing protein [Microbulbifer sp. PSTR4-B]|uniref:alcohol dehydrogenase catalytic domain-containing protein n=1 Tax=unclassified Microbulbifer TaxID=2619833 RepID=UPI00403AB5BC
MRIVATGTCHTDAIARDQNYLVAHPIVFGYEWAGIVEAVEDWIIKVTPEDHAVLIFLLYSSCRECISGHPACYIIFSIGTFIDLGPMVAMRFPTSGGGR